MRVCPNCGYMDPTYWRHAWHKRFTDVTTIEDLEEQNLELAEKIKVNPKLYDDGLYLYKLSKRGYVVRIWRGEAKHLGTVEEPFRERFKAKMKNPRGQKKLFKEISK